MARSVVPYEFASSGGKAQVEIRDLLRALGCKSVGFLEEFEDASLLLQFEHMGRRVQLNGLYADWMGAG